MAEDRRSTFTSRIRPVDRGRGTPRLTALVLVTTAGLVVAVLKPWGSLPDPERAAPRPVAEASHRVPPPLSTAERRAADIGRTCLTPQSWRIATYEIWGEHTVRGWKVAQAVAATGPLDPAIAPLRIGSERVLALGYCAPVNDLRPPAGSVARIWRVEGGQADELVVARVAPGFPTASGAIWAPPSGVPAAVAGPDRVPTSWPAGRYVIGVGPFERPAAVRWLAIEVREAR